MPYINVDVDLDKFDLDYLLDEVSSRYEKQKNKKEIDEWVNDIFNTPSSEINTKNISIIDQMKIDFLLKNLDKIDLNELEKLA